MRTSPLADFPEVAWRKENERQAVASVTPKEDKVPINPEGAPPFENNEELPEVRGTPIDDPVAEHESIRVGPGSDWNPDDLTDEGYEQDDPKHPSWRERLAAIWDSRPGK